MEPIVILLAVIALIAAAIAVFALRHAGKQSTAYREMQGALLEQEGERAAAVEAATRAERELEAARQELRQAQERAAQAEQQVAVSRQQMADAEVRLKDWELHRKQMVEAANAAVMDAGNKISTKLLADHKQENEAAKKQAEEITKKLFETFNAVTGRVEAMQRDGGALKEEMTLVMRALTNPSGVGKMAEVGLENLLKSFGFVAGQDFSMQYHMAGEGGSLRPDAIIYLPQNTVVVIDSKASKFLIEYEMARGTEREAAVLDQFKRSMREHVKALAHKNYRNAVQENYKKAGRDGEIGYVFSLMYFPSDASIEMLREEDPKLYDYLQEHDIILVGRTTLHGICALAKTRLMEAQHAEGHQAITEAVSQLMENVVDIIAAAGGMGSGIKKLSDSYNSMVTKLNRNTLTRMRRLGKLGVVPAKGKAIPAPLSSYEILKHEEVIDLEAEETMEDKILAIR